MRNELELYIHIPFCVRKCAYCDFLSAPAEYKVQERYLSGLLREIESFPYKEEYEVSTVFFGGGTPSILPAEWIARIMETLRRSFRFADTPEITIECNPGTADLEKLKAYRAAGINRISFGLQSAENAELALLGRIHTWEAFLQTYQEAKDAGFTNLNVDLMSALPGQTVESWERTLRRVLALHPPHISAYSLIIEEGTPFYERYHEDDERRERGDQPRLLPSEEEEREMYRLTEQLLQEQGLKRYEISNYAKPGLECRHNIGYWTGIEYAGFGLGAASLLSHTRYQNTDRMEAYLTEKPSELSRKRSADPLTQQDEMEEFMFLGLRLIRGVSETEFTRRFGKALMDVYGKKVERLCAEKLLVRENGRLFLSAEGLNLSNTVMAEFLF